MNKIFLTEPRIECKFQTNNIGFNLFKKNLIHLGFVKSFENRNVYSLYFDDINFSSVSDNLSGVTPRAKYRLRWYCRSDNKKYGLRYEKKIKKGILGTKKIINLDQLSEEINKEFLIKNISKLTYIKDFSLLPLNYLPQLFCSYRRSYYENRNGIRLTIDRNIKFSLANKSDSLFIENSNYLTSNSIIFEIKFSELQKDIVIPILKKMPSPSIRCSKYLMGQSKLLGFSYI